VKAFEIATKEADPDIKLVYNQHLSMEPEVWDKVKSTVLYLKKKGLRVDAVGWQAHLKENNNVGLDPEALKRLGELIDWAHANGLEFHVTEIDYKMKEPYDDYAARKQAIAYTNVLKVLLSRRDQGVVAYNGWGLRDGTTKHSDEHRFLFDEELRAKPVFYAIQKTLENPDDLKLIFDIPRPDGVAAVGPKFNSGLLKNGSFEEEFNNWKTWGSAEIVFDGSHSGGACAAIGPKTGLRQQVKLKPNTKYILTAWVKNEEGDKTTIKIKVDGVAKPFAAQAGSTDYKKVSVKFNTGSSSKADVYVQKWRNTDSGTSWIDDVRLVEEK
jgi:hypothetical protein